MDALTHAMLGGVIAQVGFRQRLGRASTLVAMGLGAAPDLDIFVVPALQLLGMETGPFDNYIYHRSATHSVLVLPILVLAPALVWWWFQRRDFGLMYLLCLLAVMTQPFLDVLTAYGTQVLWPISRQRYAVNVVAVVDIIYSPILLATLVGAWLVRRKRKRAGRIDMAVGIAGLVLSTAYLGLGYTMYLKAVDRGREAMSAVAPQVAAVAKVDAYPTLGTVFVWRLVARTPEGWYVGRTHMLRGREPEMTFYPQDEGPLVDRAMKAPDVHIFRWFAQDNLRPVVSRRDGTVAVDLHDMRFGRSATAGESLWAARVVFDDADAERAEVVSVGQITRARRDGAWVQMLQEAWHNLFEE